MSNIVSSSVFCAAWLVDSNGPVLRLQSVRNEGCNGLYRNNGSHAAGGTAHRFSDVLIDVNICSSAGSDGNVITFNREGPLCA